MNLTDSMFVQIGSSDTGSGDGFSVSTPYGTDTLFDGDYSTSAFKFGVSGLWGLSVSSDSHPARFYEEGMWWYRINDNTTPVISNLLNTTSLGSVVITFTTDDETNKSINYGTTTSLGTFSNNVTTTTNHTVSISGLTNNQTYYYNVTVCNFADLCETDGPYSFAITNPTYSICDGIYEPLWIADSRFFVFNTAGPSYLYGFNQPAWNQSSCLFNITSYDGASTVDIYTNDSTTQYQRIYCGTSLGTKVEVNTTPVTVASINGVGGVSCWQDYLNVTEANFKDFNVSVEVY
jgi:hypothetical protein